MWLLKHSATDKVYYLQSNKGKYIVGRSSADILLTGDSSISREHAIIEVKQTNEGIVAELTDKGSKYGTYINNGITMKTKTSPNTSYKLKHNDSVKFGMLKNVWSVEKLELIVSASTLPANMKQRLSSYIEKLDGTVDSSWNDNCTHLTMPVITLTMKVVQALSCAVPIVTLNFWIKYYECVNNNVALPDPATYIPPQNESVLDSSVVSFKVNTARKHVFNGKTFVFLSKRQYGQFCGVITSAGGRPILLEKVQMSKSALCEENTIVVQYTAVTQSQSSESIIMMGEIESFLRKKGRRLVHESNIGLGILHCSAETYCNPLYNFDANLLRKSLPDPTQRNILAQDTDTASEHGSSTQSGSAAARKMSSTERTCSLEIPETITNDRTNEITTKVSTTMSDTNLLGSQCLRLSVDGDLEVDLSEVITQKFEGTGNKSSPNARSARSSRSSEAIKMNLSNAATQQFPKADAKTTKEKGVADDKKRKKTIPDRKEKDKNAPISSFFQPKKKNSAELNKAPVAEVSVAKKSRATVVDSDDDDDVSFRSASSTSRNQNSVVKSFANVSHKRRQSDDEDDPFGFESKDSVDNVPSKKSKTVVSSPVKRIVKKTVDLQGFAWASKELSEQMEGTPGNKRKQTFADEEAPSRKKLNTVQPLFKLPENIKKPKSKQSLNSTTKNPESHITRETLNLSKITAFNKTDNLNYSRNFEKNCVIDWLSCALQDKVKIKKEESVIDLDDETKLFLSSVRDGIQVQFKKMSIISKPPVNVTDMDVTGVLNFKKFRKNHPLHSRSDVGVVALVKYVVNPREKSKTTSMENNDSSDEDDVREQFSSGIQRNNSTIRSAFQKTTTTTTRRRVF